MPHSPWFQRFDRIRISCSVSSDVQSLLFHKLFERGEVSVVIDLNALADCFVITDLNAADFCPIIFSNWPVQLHGLILSIIPDNYTLDSGELGHVVRCLIINERLVSTVGFDGVLVVEGFVFRLWNDHFARV